MDIRYIVVEEKYLNGNLTRHAFGLAMVDVEDGVTIPIACYNDLSDELEEVEELAARCNDLNPDREQLVEVIEDFLM